MGESCVRKLIEIKKKEERERGQKDKLFMQNPAREPTTSRHYFYSLS